MKTLNIKYLFAVLVLVFAFIACNKNEDKKDCRDIVIEKVDDVQVIHGPVWFGHVIDSLFDNHVARNMMRLLALYTFKHQEQYYICLQDPVHSGRNRARFYTCFGIWIDPLDSMWYDLLYYLRPDLDEEKKPTLIGIIRVGRDTIKPKFIPL